MFLAPASAIILPTAFELKFERCSCVQISFRGSNQRCSIKKLSLNIPQNSQENICVGVCVVLKRHSNGVFIVNLEHNLTPFSSVSSVDFEQVRVS